MGRDEMLTGIQVDCRPAVRSLGILAAALVSIVVIAACTTEGTRASASEALTAAPTASLFATTTKRVVIEVDYMPGAEPFVEPTAAVEDPWSVFRANANALFEGRKRLVVPSRRRDMERLDDVAGAAFDEADIVAIAEKHWTEKSDGETTSFYFVFLNGYFKDENGDVLEQIPGVSVRGRGIVGIFKPAITSDWNDPDTPIYMEQATLVHELGHVVGLVDRGVPSTTPHRAEAQGAHCDNPACIMYWENVLVKDGVDFADTYLRPRHDVLFGPECLDDVRTFAAARRRP